ncbi:MAG: S41 family peptidase [Betaproteobacteria bacterium]
MISRRPLLVAFLACVLTLAGCGGGGGSGGCSLPEQKSWLQSYMDDWYFWYALKPSPDPNDSAFDTIDKFFRALLYQGTSAEFPADRWSFSQTTESFDQFFSAGQSLGYGIFVAGLEVMNQPDAPLRVRYVEPASPAAGLVQRGETIVSINGRATSELIAADDFSALTPAKAGDVLSLVVRNAAGAERDVSVTAAVFTLTPVSVSTTLATPAGTKVGYVVLKDFISQASAPLDTAFAQFKAAGVHELVLDLRYNGGGLISTANDLANDVVGSAAVGQTFASLTYNDKHQDSNTVYRFAAKASALGVARAYVLTGQRTCSASELVVNGLKPFLQVVQVGDTTCGKPVGFLPQDHCGTTFSAVVFEARNAAGAGRYWNGLTPTCPAADDLDHALGDPAERLTATALAHIDTGSCPATATALETPQHLRPAARRTFDEGDRPAGMIDR